MTRGIREKCFVLWLAMLSVGVCFLPSVDALGGEMAPAPEMPAHWKVVSDFPVPAEQVKAMSSKLGADISSVRNTIYDVNGKRVQINVIVTPDPGNAEMLMMKLKSMKVEDALLRKELIVYEFVGQNDALPVIAEGRRYIDSK